MANYNSFTTSNAFQVNNMEAFKKEMVEIGIEDFFEIYKDGRVCLCSYEGLYATTDHEDYEEMVIEEDEFIEFIQKHMVDDSTIFVSTVGHEKLRYLTADCYIVTKNNIEFRNFFNSLCKEFEVECIF